MPQGLSGRVRKILPTRGFDPRTVQLIGSRYTMYWNSLSNSQHYCVFLRQLLVVQQSAVFSEISCRNFPVPGKIQTISLVRPRTSPSTPFLVHLSQIIILYYQIYKTEKMPLNKPRNDQNKKTHYRTYISAGLEMSTDMLCHCTITL
jgi:hypothetical protein